MGASCLWIQVDCKAVAEILAGRASLQSCEHRPIFVRIARAMLKLHNSYWRPICDSLDLVLWAPREFNTVADHAVNATLDTGQSWARPVEEGELAQAFQTGSLVRLCVDGGLRRNGAAARVALYQYEATGDEPGYKKRLLAQMGKMLYGVHSAFEAEVLALEFALKRLLPKMIP